MEAAEVNQTIFAFAPTIIDKKKSRGPSGPDF